MYVINVLVLFLSLIMRLKKGKLGNSFNNVKLYLHFRKMYFLLSFIMRFDHIKLSTGNSFKNQLYKHLKCTVQFLSFIMRFENKLGTT